MNLGRSDEVALEERARLIELTEPATEFVQRELRDVVALGEQERLVPLKSTYELHSDHSADGTTSAVRVAMAAITLGRTIDGIAVVGDGSHITVYFNVSGNVVGFDADWSAFERRATVHRKASKAVVDERAVKIAGSRASAVPRSVLCGYWDAGHRRTPNDTLRPACQFTYVAETGWIVDDIVPAAITFEPDLAWPETLALKPE